MKIFTTDAIKRIDRVTLENEGITELELMERAASAVAFCLTSPHRTLASVALPTASACWRWLA